MLYIPISRQRRHLDRLTHQREGAQHVGEFVFGQTIDMRDDAIQLSAQLRSLRRIGHAVVMAAQSDFRRQVVIFRRRADEPRGAADDGVEEAVALREAGDGEL